MLFFGSHENLWDHKVLVYSDSTFKTQPVNDVQQVEMKILLRKIAGMLIHVYTHGNICLHASLSVLSAPLLNSN